MGKNYYVYQCYHINSMRREIMSQLYHIIIIEFLTSQIWLGNIHLSWDVVINRISLGGLICSLKSFLQLNMCQELDFCSCVYVFGCKLSLVRLCDSDFGITSVDYITIGITCAAFYFHKEHISFASSWSIIIIIIKQRLDYLCIDCVRYVYRT